MVTPWEQWYVSTKSVTGLFPILLHSPEILLFIIILPTLFYINVTNCHKHWWQRLKETHLQGPRHAHSGIA